MENKVLKINNKNTFRVCMETLTEFNDSAFKDQYIKAAKILRKIIKNNKEIIKNNKEKEEDYGLNNRLDREEVYNNIIAFTGERGSGKTSTMLSFGKSLTKKNRGYINDLEGEFKEIYKDIHENRKYILLKLIDPSIFNDKDSIVEIVVAEMFREFKDLQGERSYIDKQELIMCFENVYQDLRTINEGKKGLFNGTVDNLEVLDKLSSANSLENHMKKLIEKFLHYMNNNGEKYHLVIPIDDLDMNIKAGEQMLEDIRRYLISPQVVILMAVKFEQVNEVVKQRNIEQLHSLMKFYSTIDKTNVKLEQFAIEIENKTQKYLEKLIPVNRRIYMPNFFEAEDTIIKIEINDEAVETVNNEDRESLKSAFVRLFKEKINYYIITESHMKNILPWNLRGIVDLIVKLEMMGDNNQQNVNELIEYYRGVAQEKLQNSKFKEYLNELIDCNISIINYRVLMMLNNELFIKIYAKENKAENEIERHIIEIDKNKNIILEHNIDFGEIISWIKMYEVYNESTEERLFLELIKCLYSLRLIENCFGKEEIALLSITGIDLCGSFFKITRNMKYNQIVDAKKFEVNNCLKFSEPSLEELASEIKEFVDNEDLDEDKLLYSFRYNNQQLYNKLLDLKEKGEIKVKMQCQLLLKQIDYFYQILNIEYFNVVPSFRRQVLSKLYRKGERELNALDKMGFKNFSWQPFNMITRQVYGDLIDASAEENEDKAIRSSVYNQFKKKEIKQVNNKNYKALFIMNIDYFIQLLTYFDLVFQNRRFDSARDFKDILSYIEKTINRIHEELMEAYSIDSKIEDNSLIAITQVYKEFIDNNLNDELRRNEGKTTISRLQKENIDAIMDRIYNYIGSTASALRNNKRELTIVSKEKIASKIKKELLMIADHLENTKVYFQLRILINDYNSKLSEIKLSKFLDTLIEGRDTIKAIKDQVNLLDIIQEE